MTSLADSIFELDANVAIVTETWLQDGQLDGTVLDIAGEHGLSIEARNRLGMASNRRQYGGVAIISRSSSSNFKPLEIDNPENFEVLCVTGKVSKLKEKVAIIVVCIPPGYTKLRADTCVEYVADVVAEVKRKIESPIIVVGGD